MKDIDPKELFELEDKVLVDVRSPHEFREFHIPGAINVPLFEDEEKKLIGYIYRSKGVEKAKEVGEEIAKKKLDFFYETFKELKEKHRNVVVYCWRGGMRSRGICEAMAKMGLDLLRLRGGYRAYRKFILKDMERILSRINFIVITGKTGVGKTKIIKALKVMGLPALDLEDLAKDRGSVFGSVGIKEKVSQKMFDSLLYEELRKIGEGWVFVEDESSRIGNIHLPESFWRRKSKGIFIEITADMETRIKNIEEDYTASEGWEEEALQALYRIRKYLGPQKFSYALKLFEERNFRELIGFLIREYYDKRYKQFGEPVAVFDCTDTERCLEEIKGFYESLAFAKA